jgi:alpha-glucosidase (family GH31 glycosyl hydrolase)
LDVTNPQAVRWFVRRLKKLQSDFSIDGFKFDAGEPCFLPPMFKTFKPIMSPLEYTRLWVQEVASNFSVAEVEP